MAHQGAEAVYYRAHRPREAIPGQAEDGERIPGGLNGVRRLLTAGLDLQAALELVGDHPASGRICYAADELDQAIRGLRDTTFDHLAGERPPRTPPRAQSEPSGLRQLREEQVDDDPAGGRS